MRITKTQLRRIIREERARLLENKYDKLPQAGDPDEAARLKAQRDAAVDAMPDIKAGVQVPNDLFEELVEYLEDMAGFKMKGGGFVASRGRDLLAKVQKQVKTK